MLLPPSVAEAVERLYAAFAAYPAPKSIDGCPCCVGESDREGLHAAPLRQITAEQLGRYPAKALTTMGNEDDYRHFLPRLLELSLAPNGRHGLDPWLIFGKLSYGHWTTWPMAEQKALVGFLQTIWQALIEYPVEDPVPDERQLIWEKTDAIECASQSGLPIAPLLEQLWPPRSANALDHLAHLAAELLFREEWSLVEASVLEELKAWLRDPAKLFALNQHAQARPPSDDRYWLADGIESIRQLLEQKPEPKG